MRRRGGSGGRFKCRIARSRAACAGFGSIAGLHRPPMNRSPLGVASWGMKLGKWHELLSEWEIFPTRRNAHPHSVSTPWGIGAKGHGSDGKARDGFDRRSIGRANSARHFNFTIQEHSHATTAKTARPELGPVASHRTPSDNGQARWGAYLVTDREGRPNLIALVRG